MTSVNRNKEDRKIAGVNSLCKRSQKISVNMSEYDSKDKTTNEKIKKKLIFIDEVKNTSLQLKRNHRKSGKKNFETCSEIEVDGKKKMDGKKTGKKVSNLEQENCLSNENELKPEIQSKTNNRKKITKTSKVSRQKGKIGKLCTVINEDKDENASMQSVDQKCMLKKTNKDIDNSFDAICAVKSDCKVKSKKDKRSSEENLRKTPLIKKSTVIKTEERSVLKSKPSRKKTSPRKEILIPEGISPAKRRKVSESKNSSSCDAKRPIRKIQGKTRKRAARLSSVSNKDIARKKVKDLRTVGRKSLLGKHSTRRVNKTSGQVMSTKRNPNLMRRLQPCKKMEKDPQNSITRKSEEDLASVDSENVKNSKDVASKKYVGAHLSVAGGLYKCIEEAVKIGAEACGLFLKSQRQWAGKPLSEETVFKFKETIKIHNYPIDKVIPHGSYLLNCGSPDSELLEKSLNALIDELQRCERLGIKLYNFHPVVENMCGQGNTVGGKLEELRGIINRVNDKSRIGVCIDTCHAFAAGFDISNKEDFDKFVRSFEEIVGFEYLKALHLNDSKGKLGCHLDRHENIGKGNIGLKGFRNVMNEPKFNNIPMILETPSGLEDEEEIDILYSLCR